MYTLVGYDEALKLAMAFKTLLEQTHQQALAVRKETQGIVDNIHEIVKLSPKDNLTEAGIE